MNIGWQKYLKKYHSTFSKGVQGADYHQGQDNLDEVEEDDETDYAIELSGDENLLDQQDDHLNDGSEMDDM